MTATMRKFFRPCVPGAFEGGLSRTAFFDGMVLTEGDMVREQSYWRGKRRLTNRALGQGVVWGLSVQWDSRSRSFCVSPGYGLSCCGDDLVVACAQEVAESALVDRCGEDFRRVLAAAVGSKALCDGKAVPEAAYEACLLLEYVECAEDARASYEDGCGAATGLEEGCRYGAVRETTRLRLVPPPPARAPGVIAAFSERIAQLRAKLEEEQPGALVDPLRFGEKPQAWFSVAFLDANKKVLSAQGEDLPLDATTPVSTTVHPSSSPTVRLGLEPPPGYVFTSVQAVGSAAPVPAADALLGAFEEFGYSNTAQVAITFHVVAAPLFGCGAGWSADVSLALGAGSTTATLTATLSNWAEVATETDCTCLLTGRFALEAAPGAIGRTLALGAICGWFVGRLGKAGTWKQGDPALTADDKAQALLAWTVCRLAWRGLFGIDPQLAPQAGLDQCLRELFKAWCEAFHYKGPRCDCDAHGIVLGTVRLSRKGRIEAFDEWRHRRHVLTGPLLTHWSAQVGLAPLDQSVAGLAQWVCCVARMRLPAMDKGELPDEAALRIIGGALTAPRAYELGEPFHGVPVGDVEELQTGEFLGELLQALFRPARFFGSSRELRAFAAPGHVLHLLQPQRPAQPSAAEAANLSAQVEKRKQLLLQEAGRMDARMPATARRALGDFVVAYADGVSLKMLKPSVEAPAFDAMVGALERGGVVHIADLVELGPEAALEKVAPQLANQPQFADARAGEKAMALVYDTAVKAVADAGQAVAERVAAADEAEPFTRSDLAGTATLTAVRKAAPHLRDGALSASGMRGIAARALARRG